MQTLTQKIVRLIPVFFFTLILTALASKSAQAQVVKDRVIELQKQDTKLSSEASADDKLDIELWISLMHSAGNTDALAFNCDNTILWRKDKFESRWKLGASYYRVFSSNSQTVGTLSEYIFGTYRLDYYFNPRATIYVGGGGYSDRITGIDAAGKGFAGVTYLLIDEEKTKLRGELGYDYTYEDRVLPDANVSIHSAAAGAEFNHEFNEHVSLFDVLEFQQNVMTGADFRMQNEIGIKSKLSQLFSIKISHKLRFDNLPVTGFGKLDAVTDVAFGLTF